MICRREADAQAHAWPRALRERLGLRPGERVALMLQNVPQSSIAVHAVWLRGGVVTTVNPMNKRRELRHQLTDAGVRIAVCLESLYEVVEAARADTPRSSTWSPPRSSTCSTGRRPRWRLTSGTSARAAIPIDDLLGVRRRAGRAGEAPPATRRCSPTRRARPGAEGRDQHPRGGRPQPEVMTRWY